MTCSELCKWLAEWQLPESVVAVIRGKNNIEAVYMTLNFYCLLQNKMLMGIHFFNCPP